MELRATYPSPEHQQAAQAIVEFFSANYQIEAVLLLNSCARGKATRDSCLDMLVLARPDILKPHLFQCFDRLYNAYQEFLQALFISRRTYPIAYNKWIREQIVDILGLPDLYGQLAHILEIHRFESREILDKAQHVEQLLEKYAPEIGTSR